MPRPAWAGLATLVRFGLAGLANTALGFAVILAAQFGLGLDAPLANAAGYAAGFLLGFALNRRFVFKGRDGGRAAAVRYVIAVATAFAANQAVLAAAGRLFGAAPAAGVAAQAAAVASYTLLLFALCNLWVFRAAKLAAAPGP